MGFLLKLQTLEEDINSIQHAASASSYSQTTCFSTTSQVIC
jgi:hypothetical protein